MELCYRYHTIVIFVAGYGIISKRPISIGDFVCEYRGEKLESLETCTSETNVYELKHNGKTMWLVCRNNSYNCSRSSIQKHGTVNFWP